MPPSRIDELRRRVQSDPASIAFAQLAEVYRRSGQTEDAVRVCRDGLTRHPGYLSARVTLGRALLDLGQLMGAREELEFVVAEAPENLTAVRGLAEIAQREGDTAEALTYYQRALTLAPHDPEIEGIVQQLSRQAGADAASPSSGLSFDEAQQERLTAAERVPLAAPQSSPPPGRHADEGPAEPFDFDRLVAALGLPAAPAQVEAAVAGRAMVLLDLPEPLSLGPDPFAALEAELRASKASLPARPAPWSPVEAEPSDPSAPSDWLPAPADLADTDPQWPFLTAEVLADTLLTDDPLDPPADLTYDADAAGVMSDPLFAGDEGAGPGEAQAGLAAPHAPAGWEDDAISPPTETAEATALMWTFEGAGWPVVAADEAAATLSGDAVPVPVVATPADDAAPAVLQTEEAGVSEEPTAASARNRPAAAEPPEDVLDELESWLTTLQNRTSL